MSDRAHYFFVFILIVFYFSCSESETEPEDCAGIINGSSICGCTEAERTNFQGWGIDFCKMLGLEWE
jgi:hypothetical protein